MKNYSLTVMSGLGVFLFLFSQTADAGLFRHHGVVDNPSSTVKAAQKYVEQGLGFSKAIFKTALPQKIGLKRAFQARRAISLLAVWKLARSNFVPVFVQGGAKDEGDAVGVVVLPRGQKSPEVLGSVNRPFFILRSKSGMAVIIPSALAKERSGNGIADNQALITILGNMIKPLDLASF